MTADGNILYMLPFFMLATLAAFFWVWMLVECLTQESSEGTDKLTWTLVILFTNLLGSVIYFCVRRLPRTRAISNQYSSRLWPLTFSIGLILAIAASVVFLMLFPESHSIVAYMQVKSPPSSIVPIGNHQQLTPKDSEIFQQTQLTLLKSNFVLHSALDQTEVSQLESVSKKQNPLHWLSNEVRFSFPGEGEILQVQYEGNENPDDMKKIIDSVVAVYCNEVIQGESDAPPQTIRIVQPAFATSNINNKSRYFAASAVGLSTFFLTCMGSVLIGAVQSYRKSTYDWPR